VPQLESGDSPDLAAHLPRMCFFFRAKPLALPGNELVLSDSLDSAVSRQKARCAAFSRFEPIRSP